MFIIILIQAAVISLAITSAILIVSNPKKYFFAEEEV